MHPMNMQGCLLTWCGLPDVWCNGVTCLRLQPDRKDPCSVPCLELCQECGMLQASLENLMETQPRLSDTFLNRLFALLNWTLTEFTISSQVPTSATSFSLAGMRSHSPSVL